MKWCIKMTVTCVYQMTMLTRRIMTVFRQAKKSLRGFPLVSILPRVRPKATEKTNRPTILSPFEVPATGTLSSIGVPGMSSRVAVQWQFNNNNEDQADDILKQHMGHWVRQTFCSNHRNRTKRGISLFSLVSVILVTARLSLVETLLE